MFQNPDNQFVGVTVKHDIAFGLENQQIPPHEEMKKKIDYYANLVGMQDFLNKEPHQTFWWTKTKSRNCRGGTGYGTRCTDLR